MAQALGHYVQNKLVVYESGTRDVFHKSLFIHLGYVNSPIKFEKV